MQWNPSETPKFKMGDFDEKRINALNELFRDIELFICNFHGEQAWTRWPNKLNKQVAENNLINRLKIFYHGDISLETKCLVYQKLVTRNEVMGCVFWPQLTSANKHE